MNTPCAGGHTLLPAEQARTMKWLLVLEVTPLCAVPYALSDFLSKSYC